MFGQQWLFASPVLLVIKIPSVKYDRPYTGLVIYLWDLGLQREHSLFHGNAIKLLLPTIDHCDNIYWRHPSLLFICSVAVNANDPLSLLWKLFAYSIWSHLIPNTITATSISQCISVSQYSCKMLAYNKTNSCTAKYSQTNVRIWEIWFHRPCVDD